MSIRIEVWGNYACFSRPEMKTERVSYDVMTPSAALGLVLQDVHYVIECHFDLTERAAPGDNAGKFQDILRRRLTRGQCYHTPYFGCREFPASFREWPGGTVPTVPLTQDLGWMLYDLEYKDPQNIQPQFFRARLVNGVLDCRNAEVVT